MFDIFEADKCDAPVFPQVTLTLHPRLNPVGILPPGSRPSDAQSTPLRILMPGVCDTPLQGNLPHLSVVRTCEACEAEPRGEAFSPG